MEASTNGTRQRITARVKSTGKAEWLCTVSHVGKVKLDGSHSQPWRRRRARAKCFPWAVKKKSAGAESKERIALARPEFPLAHLLVPPMSNGFRSLQQGPTVPVPADTHQAEISNKRRSLTPPTHPTVLAVSKPSN